MFYLLYHCIEISFSLFLAKKTKLTMYCNTHCIVVKMYGYTPITHKNVPPEQRQWGRHFAGILLLCSGFLAAQDCFDWFEEI